MVGDEGTKLPLKGKVTCICVTFTIMCESKVFSLNNVLDLHSHVAVIMSPIAINNKKKHPLYILALFIMG